MVKWKESIFKYQGTGFQINSSILNKCEAGFMKNFRIYKYHWGIWLAEYLPGREIWYKLHFLRVKWEMLGVYSKSFLSQLTSTITCHVISNLASRTGGFVWDASPSFPPAHTLPGLGNDAWVPQSQRLWNLSLFLFAKGFR
jgi:hypothetical protein